MTRGYIYGLALVAFLAATGMTITSIFSTWLSWEVTTPSSVTKKELGLHYAWNTIDNSTTRHIFPQNEDCGLDDRNFCSIWRSVGFMVYFATILELATIVAYVVVIAGGKQKRETGWKVVVFLLVLVAALQCASMSIVGYLFEEDDRFFTGWVLDQGWSLITASWSIAAVSAIALTLSAFLYPEEGGYELIPSDRLGG